MKAKLAKLIDVKSIVTLLLTVVFCVLCLMGTLPMEFMTIYTMIIGFYFGTQKLKNDTPTPTYTGPQHGQTLPEIAEPIYETVNTADVQKIHPPDAVAGLGADADT